MTTSAQQHTKTDPGRVLGIVGLILAFVIPVVGLILSIIGLTKSKAAGFKNIPGLIGIILNSTFIVLQVFFFFIIILAVPSLQQNAENTRRKNDVAIVGASLYDYAGEHGGYFPSSLTELDDVSDVEAIQNDEILYTPRPSGCITTCTGYSMTINLRGNNVPYTVDSSDY